MSTQRETQMLDYIRQYMGENGGVSPSYQEIAGHMGLKHRSNVHRIVEQLKKKGMISHDKRLARHFRLMDHCPYCGRGDSETAGNPV